MFDQPTADTPDATATDHAVAEKMNACWANFAKTGDPNGEGPGRDSRDDYKCSRSGAGGFRHAFSALGGRFIQRT